MGRYSVSLKTLYVLLLVSLFGVLTISGIFLGGGSEVSRIGEVYLERGFELPNINNAVFGIYGMYRFYDTLFELLIFATAVLGITIFSDMEDSGGSSSGDLIESHVVDSSASLLYPIIALFGIYLAYSAHQGPGGGFAGGVIGGSGVLLLAIALGTDRIGQKFYETTMKKVEYLILLLVLSILVVSLLAPVNIYLGSGGTGVIIIINLAIGTKVFIGTWTILHFFVKHRGEI